MGKENDKKNIRIRINKILEWTICWRTWLLYILFLLFFFLLFLLLYYIIL